MSEIYYPIIRLVYNNAKPSMTRILLLFLVYTLFTSCNSNDCNQLTNFSSYNEAVKTIRKSDFKYSDKCDTSKSSWIYSAEYYSCDGDFGYFILKTKTATYIHANMPKNIWKSFKNADSFGSYYNLNIKGKFRLSINQ